MKRFEAFECVDSARAAENVAERDSAQAAGKPDGNGGAEQEFAAMHGDAREHEDGLIGNQRPDDAKHQQRKNRQVSVMREEEIDMFHARD